MEYAIKRRSCNDLKRSMDCVAEGRYTVYKERKRLK